MCRTGDHSQRPASPSRNPNSNLSVVPEAHLLPLILSRKGQLNVTAASRSNVGDTDECPNSEYFRNADKIRLPLKNLVEGTCPSQPVKYVVTLFPTEIRSIQFNRYRCFVYLLIILLMQNSLLEFS